MRNERTPIPRATPENADCFTRAYLDCAEWCGLDEEDREAFELAVAPKWSADTLKRATEDCEAFQRDNAADLDGLDPEQCGHDFYLTRNGHGAGFWDRGLGARGQRLTEACRPYGETYVSFDPDTETLTEE